MSINREVNSSLPSLSKTEITEKGELIVKKAKENDKNGAKLLKYFEEEVRILQYMRGLKCNEIASYYIEEIELEEEIKQIFSSFY